MVLCLSAVNCTILFFLLWFLCLGMRANDTEVKEEKPKIPAPVYDDANVDIQDKEKIPFY